MRTCARTHTHTHTHTHTSLSPPETVPCKLIEGKRMGWWKCTQTFNWIPAYHQYCPPWKDKDIYYFQLTFFPGYNQWESTTAEEDTSPHKTCTEAAEHLVEFSIKLNFNLRLESKIVFDVHFRGRTSCSVTTCLGVRCWERAQWWFMNRIREKTQWWFGEGEGRIPFRPVGEVSEITVHYDNMTEVCLFPNKPRLICQRILSIFFLKRRQEMDARIPPQTAACVPACTNQALCHERSAAVANCFFFKLKYSWFTMLC